MTDDQLAETLTTVARLERAMSILAAIATSRTSAEVESYISTGAWPDEVQDLLHRPAERDEFLEHLRLIVGVLNEPNPVGDPAA